MYEKVNNDKTQVQHHYEQKYEKKFKKNSDPKTNQTPTKNFRAVEINYENNSELFDTEDEFEPKSTSPSADMIEQSRDTVRMSVVSVSYKEDLTECPMVKVGIKDIELAALIDTGSQISAISKNKKEWLEDKIGRLRNVPCNSVSMQGAFGEKTKSKEQVWVEVEIGGCQMPFAFLVAPRLTADIILGIDFVKHYGAIIDVGKNIVNFEKIEEKKKPK